MITENDFIFQFMHKRSYKTSLLSRPADGLTAVSNFFPVGRWVEIGARRAPVPLDGASLVVMETRRRHGDLTSYYCSWTQNNMTTSCRRLC